MLKSFPKNFKTVLNIQHSEQLEWKHWDGEDYSNLDLSVEKLPDTSNTEFKAQGKHLIYFFSSGTRI
jgi:hypothetical protein